MNLTKSFGGHADGRLGRLEVAAFARQVKVGKSSLRQAGPSWLAAISAARSVLLMWRRHESDREEMSPVHCRKEEVMKRMCRAKEGDRRSSPGVTC